MSWRYTGRARVDPSSPSAFGICDRCGLLWNLVNLNYQWDWRGPRLANLRLRVCPPCTDKPSVWLKTVVYPPDPVPVLDPRPQNYTIADNGSPFAPPLPWPIQPSGPAVLPIYLLADNGDVITDDGGHLLLADASPIIVPPPVYATPPLPPLPSDIEWSEP